MAKKKGENTMDCQGCGKAIPITSTSHDCGWNAKRKLRPMRLGGVKTVGKPKAQDGEK